MSQQQLDSDIVVNFGDQASACGLVDFDGKPHLVPGFVTDTWFLIVHGDKPNPSISVKLTPVMYTRKPDYWEIQLVGCSPGTINIPVMTPYEAQLEVTHYRGKKGIEVVGSGGKRVKINNP